MIFSLHKLPNLLIFCYKYHEALKYVSVVDLILVMTGLRLYLQLCHLPFLVSNNVVVISNPCDFSAFSRSGAWIRWTKFHGRYDAKGSPFARLSLIEKSGLAFMSHDINLLSCLILVALKSFIDH